MATVSLINQHRMYKIVARHTDVQDELSRVARQREGEARSILARHRKTGEHSIGSEQHAVDRIVYMDGYAAMAVEEGHHAPDGSWVEGIHALRRH